MKLAIIIVVAGILIDRILDMSKPKEIRIIRKEREKPEKEMLALPPKSPLDLPHRSGQSYLDI